MAKNFYITNKERGNRYKTSWNIYPKLLNKINLKRGGKILDAGCGDGELSKYIGKSFELYGMDFDKESVKIAEKRRYKKIINMDLENIKFNGKEFDKTISIQVFQYLENPNKAFEELIKVTKEEIIIAVPNFRWLKIKSIFSKNVRKNIKTKKSFANFTGRKFLIWLARKNTLKIKIFYVSNRFESLRNIYPNLLSSDVVGVFKIK